MLLFLLGDLGGKGLPIEFVQNLHLILLLMLKLDHLIEFIFYHPTRLLHFISFLLLLQVPQLYLLCIVLLGLFHFLHANLLQSNVLLSTNTLIQGLHLHPSLPCLNELLGFSVVILLLLLFIILEHTPVHHHVHVSLK